MDSPPAGRSLLVRHAEAIATVLLSLATVLTAWSAFQSAKWNGVQATSFSQASASRTESVRASTLSGQEGLGDVSQFTAWLSAEEDGQTKLADRIATTFRGELAVAFRSWEAMSPLTNPDAPATPFDLPSYQRVSQLQANQLETLAQTQFRAATTANQRSDNYVLMTVIFAMALFFGAVGTRLGSARLGSALLVVGSVILVVAVFIIATFPIQV